jgi:hypothetical protein
MLALLLADRSTLIGRSGRRSAVGQVRSPMQITRSGVRQAATLATRLPGVVPGEARKGGSCAHGEACAGLGPLA